MIRKILVKDNVVDFDLSRIELKDSDVQLSRVERNILHFLVTNHNECFPASELCAQCEADSSGYIINCISNANRKLGIHFINNNKSIGYYVNSDDFEILKSDNDKSNTIFNRRVSTEDFIRIIEETCSLDINDAIIESFRQDRDVDKQVEIINLLNAEIMDLIRRIETLGKYIPEDSKFAITYLKNKLKYNIEKYYDVSKKLSAKINEIQSDLCKTEAPSSSKLIYCRPEPTPKVNEENIYQLQYQLEKFNAALRNIDSVLLKIKSKWSDNQMKLSDTIQKELSETIEKLFNGNTENTNS